METLFWLTLIAFVASYGYHLLAVSDSESAADFGGYWKWLKSWFVRDDGSAV
jgi:hypothetical protein